MTLSPILPVAVFDFVIEENNLNESFFIGQPEKAKVWVQWAGKINKLLEQGENFGLEAPTGGGKTVMAQMSLVAKPRRTLFLVPMRRLAKRHQGLFLALGGKQQTRVIIGESSKKERDWFDMNDRIIFATAHVVVAELISKPDILKSFELVVFDEIHNASELTHPYSRIARLARKLDISRIGLTASPGSTRAQKTKVLTNCCLDQWYKIEVPVSKQIGSVVHTEEVSLPTLRKAAFIDDYIKTEMRRAAYIFNDQAKGLIGTSVLLDPEKDVGYAAIKKLRTEVLQFFPEKDVGKNHHLFSDKIVAGKLASTFEEYHKWEHIYNLARTESFEAIAEYYQQKILTSNAAYAKRIIKKGRVEHFLNLTSKFLHPKLEMLEVVMKSLIARELQTIVFVSNKATGRAAYEHLSKLGVKCGLMFGGFGKDLVKEQERVLEKMEDREIQCIIATTVLREGFNLSVDVIINMTPPKSAIDQIQRSGRAGRNARNAEIIYFATPEEIPKIYSIDRNIKRLKLSEFSQFEVVPRLGGVVEVVSNKIFQPNLF